MAGYSVTFSVVDNATKQIDAINRRMTAMRAPMDRLSKQVSRFVDVSGLRTIERGFAGIASAAGKVLRTLVEIVPVMGALTGAATIGGMAKLVSSYAAWSQTLTATADNLGLTTQKLQQFEDATRLAGGNARDMDAALKSLYKAQTDMARGTASADQIGWFNRLKINIRDANGHLRTMADLMPEVVQKIADIKNPADRAAASAALLGDANANLVETFRRSHQSFGQWLTDASRYTELTEKQKDQLQSFAEAQGRVSTAFDHLGQQIAATLAQNFTPLMNKLAEFVEKHTPEIIAAVDRISQKFAAWLSGIKWDDVERGLNSLITSLTWITTHLDQIKTAAEIIAGLFVVKWGVQAVAAVTQLVSALGTAGAGAGAAAGGTGLLGALGGVAAITAAIAVAGNQSRLGGAAAGATAGAATAGVAGAIAGGVGGALWKRPDFLPKWLDLTPGEFWHKYVSVGKKPAVDVQRGGAIRDQLSKDLNLTPEQASGIVGNLQAESGLQAVQEKNPIAGRGGFGWAQWTGSRRTAFEQYAAAHNLDPSSDRANYGYLVSELQSPEYAGTLAALRQQKTAEGAAASFEATYERPAVSNAATRAAYATQFAAAPAALPPPTANVNGAVDVNITGKNLPPDSAVTARGTGAVNVAPPRVEYQDFATA